MFIDTEFMSVLSKIRLGINPHKRKLRSSFTDYQLSELTKRFKASPYIKGQEKKSMARNLGLSTQSIRLWFSHERERLQREAKKTNEDKQKL